MSTNTNSFNKSVAQYDFGDYVIDLNSIRTPITIYGVNNGTYEGYRKDGNTPVAVKIQKISASRNTKACITKLLRSIRGVQLSGHLPQLTFRMTKQDELLLITNLLKESCPLLDILKNSNKPLSQLYNVHNLMELVIRIVDDLIKLKNDYGFLHNEIQLRRWIAYKIPNKNNQYFLTLNLPIKSMCRLDLVYDYESDDVEYLSPEAQLGFMSKDLDQQDKEVTWSMGIQLYECLVGNKPFSIKDAENYAKSQGKSNYVTSKKLILYIRDNPPDYSKILNKKLVELFEKVFVFRRDERIRLADFNQELIIANSEEEPWLIEVQTKEVSKNDEKSLEFRKVKIKSEVDNVPVAKNPEIKTVDKECDKKPGILTKGIFQKNPLTTATIYSTDATGFYYSPGNLETPQEVEKRVKELQFQKNYKKVFESEISLDGKKVDEGKNPFDVGRSFGNFTQNNKLEKLIVESELIFSDYDIQSTVVLPKEQLLENELSAMFEDKKPVEMMKQIKAEIAEEIKSSFKKSYNPNVEFINLDISKTDSVFTGQSINFAQIPENIKPVEFKGLDLIKTESSNITRNVDVLFPDLKSDIGIISRARSKTEDIALNEKETDLILKHNEANQTWGTAEDAILAMIMEKSSESYIESQQNSQIIDKKAEDKQTQFIINEAKINCSFQNIVQKSSLNTTKKSGTTIDSNKTDLDNKLDNSEKLYFARLRVRLLIFNLTHAQLKKLVPHKSVFYLIIQFHMLKQGCYLYNKLTDMLSETDSNPFGLKNSERWENYCNTEGFLNMAKIFWTDANLMLNKFEKTLFVVEELLHGCTPQQKVQLGVYIKTINDNYQESEWSALDLLQSSTIVNIIHKKKAQEKKEETRIEWLRLECFIKIMQIMVSFGIWELSYIDEEFSDEIRLIGKLNDENALLDKILQYNEWGV